MAAEDIKIQQGDVQQKAQTAATQLANAARPGPVPVAGASSPIDAAAAGVAAAVGRNVTAMSAKLAPKSADGLARSTTAVANMQSQEEQNAQQVGAVPQGLHEQARPKLT